MLYALHNGSRDGDLIELKSSMAQLPGCSFLGVKATSVIASLFTRTNNKTERIIDSGSDITLISHKALQKLDAHVKVHAGKRINLLQVTGNATISGYVTVPLFFETEQGPICLKVEAYIVKGMSTPFILGNDFSDQYQLSIICNDNGTRLTFGNSGRSIPVYSSTANSFQDEEGRTFKVLTKIECHHYKVH